MPRRCCRRRPSAENIPPQPEIDPAGDRPTNCLPPVPSSDDLMGKVLAEAMDLCGCESLRRKLRERKPDDIQMIFSELKPHICKLMCHRSGSFVVQKLIQVCDEQHIHQLVTSFTTDPSMFITACLDPLGAGSMKIFLDCLRTSEEISHIISFICYFLTPLVNDQFGSMVIRHCFRIFTAEETKPMLNVIAINCVEISVTKSGSCLLLRDILTKGPLRVTLVPDVPRKIIVNAAELSRTKFGSRIVRRVLVLDGTYSKEEFAVDMLGAFRSLSMNKYGSKVVKKFIKTSERKCVNQIIKAIISGRMFFSIFVDPYGYSVLQTSVKYAEGRVRKTLLDLICQHSELLRKKSKTCQV